MAVNYTADKEVVSKHCRQFSKSSRPGLFEDFVELSGLSIYASIIKEILGYNEQ